MDDALIQRVEALERAVTDDDHDLSGLANEAEALDRLDRIEEDYDDLETRIAELEAATQALRGYVGNIRAVNEEVETRAETAIAKVEALEDTVPQTDTAYSGHQNTGVTEHAKPERGTPERAAAERGTNTSPAREDDPRAADGGFSREQKMRSHDSKTRNSIEETQTHCQACGQTRQDAGCSNEGRLERKDNVGNTAAVPEARDDSAEKLRQSDPLISEGGENDSGALSRFKRLL